HAHTSPFEDFSSPTEQNCRKAYSVLEQLHDETMRRDFEYIEDPEKGWPHVMQALIVATLSQATSWNNAKRALKSMTDTYGSPFAYQEILDGGEEQLKDALRPGGMQNRKSKMVMQILVDVKTRHGKWDLDHLFTVSDEEAVKELISYKGVGPKSAFCILSICLHRKSFAVDTHIYRITGMWGWRPASASREMAQAHLDARIPDELKLSMHNLLIVHGRTCPVCRGNGNAKSRCEFQALLEKGGCV
ncbi:DNA glycosylase, partial [Paraphoma chrysanthemicola]